MSSATLQIDLGALTRNWKRLDDMSRAETAAMVKANAYGLGASQVGKALQSAGARSFFVASAEEGTNLRAALGPEAQICVLSGHMQGATALIRDMGLIPILNSTDQLVRQLEDLPGAPFGIQLDTGMHRLGMQPSEWAAVRDLVDGHPLELLTSHLACADEPDHEMNRRQLDRFVAMTEGMDVPRSLANTGGVLLGSDYHFDLTRPGIGVYGGQPFAEAEPVVTLDIPVIRCHNIEPGDTVGYGNSFTAGRPSRIATIAAGYADGLLRALGNGGAVFAGDQRCPLAGRVSMDLIGVDITDLTQDPETLRILGPEQSIDDLAAVAGTICYEILTSLGGRYNRHYVTP